MCQICGGAIFANNELVSYSGPSCSCNRMSIGGYYSPNIPYYPQTISPTCQHCFCQLETIGDKIHEKCCMCGTRRLKIGTI